LNVLESWEKKRELYLLEERTTTRTHSHCPQHLVLSKRKNNHFNILITCTRFLRHREQ
jgi:hypothetical protein